VKTDGKSLKQNQQRDERARQGITDLLEEDVTIAKSFASEGMHVYGRTQERVDAAIAYPSRFNWTPRFAGGRPVGWKEEKSDWRVLRGDF
jgi:hypothetical protein